LLILKKGAVAILKETIESAIMTGIVRVLDRLLSEHDEPLQIVSDNGTELTSNAMLKWTAINGIEWHYIAPGKPHRTAPPGKSQQNSPFHRRFSAKRLRPKRPNSCVIAPGDGTLKIRGGSNRIRRFTVVSTSF
jgi:transposase InsO family protein